MDLKDIKGINNEYKEAIINEIDWMVSRADDNEEAQLILQQKLVNLLIVLKQENSSAPLGM